MGYSLKQKANRATEYFNEYASQVTEGELARWIIERGET